jgi:hypothetical protein
MRCDASDGGYIFSTFTFPYRPCPLSLMPFAYTAWISSLDNGLLSC